MDFILENIYILLLAAAGIAQWLKATQEAKKERQNAGRPQQPEQREISYEDIEREFRDIVIPPPLPKHQSTPPPLVSQRKLQDELLRQEALNEKLKELKRTKQTRSKEGEFVHQPKPAEKEISTHLLPALSSRNEIRKAFILKEILDKPLGLR